MLGCDRPFAYEGSNNGAYNPYKIIEVEAEAAPLIFQIAANKIIKIQGKYGPYRVHGGGKK